MITPHVDKLAATGLTFQRAYVGLTVTARFYSLALEHSPSDAHRGGVGFLVRGGLVGWFGPAFGFVSEGCACEHACAREHVHSQG
jgi:hypothetical protein